mgnify:CR=1 FL=1
MAGILCAIVSHPADTIVSKLYHLKHDEHESTMKAVKHIYGDIGHAGLWRGIGPRIFMIGTLTGF